ncbi:hypothetical protein Patl1_14175 [Pistacia atlantica]|uniref:Uncharacterized protein n=1 Tax=Pistacia atlantica TaxID=434234 RepID=A0ACC1AS88_9ROSI|nr:hypothetical protein Patl1_14175 [Pistacia atlantica]
MAARLFISGAMAAFLCLASLSGASDTTPEVAFVKKTISSHHVIIFSKSYCPFCRRAKAVFKELNQVPHVIELNERGLFTKSLMMLS